MQLKSQKGSGEKDEGEYESKKTDFEEIMTQKSPNTYPVKILSKIKAK